MTYICGENNLSLQQAQALWRQRFRSYSFASRREQRLVEIRLIDLRLISQNPEFSTRQLADKVGISNNSVCNVLVTLFEKGIFKLSNFKKKPHKGQYAYLLTPKGILKKFLLTDNFIQQKRDDLGVLRAEIKTLKKSSSSQLRLPHRLEGAHGD